MLYEMEYCGGGNRWYRGGTWKIKETDKSVSFECVEVPIMFESNMPRKCRLPIDNRGQHCIRVNEEGYTVYPFRSGTPHVFSPVKENN